MTLAPAPVAGVEEVPDSPEEEGDEPDPVAVVEAEVVLLAYEVVKVCKAVVLR